MNIISMNRYKMIDTANGKFQVVKILNEYDDEDTARKYLVKLGVGNIDERTLLKEYMHKNNHSNEA